MKDIKPDLNKSNSSVMTNLDWLLQGDPVIKHLTKKYLLNKPSKSNNQGFIQRYMYLVDPNTLKWGNGFYGPKWVSTNYTLLDLINMEIDPKTELYHKSLNNYLDHYFIEYLDIVGLNRIDLCIAGMFIRFLAYGNIQNQRLDQLIDLVINTRMSDGGWNCEWFRKPSPNISSVHTTINVLEGLSEYLKMAHCNRKEEVKQVMNQGIQVLLDRQLIYQKNTATPL